MSKIRYKIEIYNKNETNGFDDTPSFTIPDSGGALAFDADASIEADSDTCSFRVENSKTIAGPYIFDDIFHVDDRIKVYLNANSSTFVDATDLIFVGNISDIKWDVSSDYRRISIISQNLLKNLLNVTKPAVYNAQTASDIVENLIDQANDDQADDDYGVKLNQITWASGNAVTTTIIPGYNRTYTPVFELIRELSSVKINEEHNFIYWLDVDDEFHWIEKDYAPVTDLVEGTDFTKIDTTKKVWEVKNAMIIDAGSDCYGRTILALYYDEFSAATYGLKWFSGKESQIDRAQQLHATCRASVETGGINDGNSFTDGALFPDSYPFTMPFNGRDDSGKDTGSAVTAANDTAYNAAIRLEARWQATNDAKAIIDLTGSVTPKVNIIIRGAYWYSSLGRPAQGEIVKVTSPSCELEEEDFRIISISHELGKNGWFVTLNLEKDIEEE